MTNEAHLDDGVLLRHLDDEEATQEDARHLAACADCRARLDGFRATSASLERLLERGADGIGAPEYDSAFLEQLTGRSRPGAPMDHGRARLGHPRLRRRSLGWAAAVALLGTLLTLQPVRAWVLRAATGAWDAITAPLVEPDPDSLVAGSVEVTLPDPEPRVVLRMAGSERPGRIVLLAVEGDGLSARLEGEGEGEILVSSDGFTVAASSASMQLSVEIPPSVAEIMLEVDGELVRGATASEWRGEELVWLLNQEE